MERINLIERIGVHKVALIFLEQFGWIEREQTVSDVGIDMQVEIIENGLPTGQLLALQIKSGESFFKEEKDGSVIYRGKKSHLEYWLSHSLPVLIILYNPKTDKAYWQRVLSNNTQETPKGWKIAIPYLQTLSTDFKNDIIKFYNNPNHYTVIDISDTSHGIARRVSAKILVENTHAKSRLAMKKMIPQLNENLKRSDYHRNEITSKKYKDKPAEVVSIFFYDSILQTDHGLTFCRTVWNAPDRKTKIKPFDTDEKVNEIEIKWDKDYSFFSDFIPENQMSKGKFLDFSDNLFQLCKNIYKSINDGIEEYKKHYDYNIFKNLILSWETQIENIHNDLADRAFPPFECKELDNIIESSVIMLHSILIVVKDKTRTVDNVIYLTKSSLDEIKKKIPFYEYERDKVR